MSLVKMDCKTALLILGFVISLVYANVPEGFTRTPSGIYWSSCVHQVPSGTKIISTKKEGTKVIHVDDSVEYIKPCPVKSLGKSLKTKDTKSVEDTPNDGWQAWTAYNNENNATFDIFLGYFNVPNSPSNFQGSILYMFTGLQNDNWVPIPGEYNTPPGFDIIQPVLQYTSNGWGLASWYVTVDENVFESTLIAVNPGDSIFGNMTRINETAWYISGISSGQNTFLRVDDPRLNTQPWAYCTLEVYGIQDCSTDFPPASSPIKFTQLQLFDQGGKNPVTPVWQALNNGADHCNASATVGSASDTTITF